VLALFDIDGTLLLGRPSAHQRALAAALAELADVPATADDVIAVRPSGRTDLEIARSVLAMHGRHDGHADAALEHLAERAGRHFERWSEDGLPDQRTAPGAADALTRLAAADALIAPLTGNLEPIARRKLHRAGLDGHFAPFGAYGSDAERREDLVPIARRRGGVPDARLTVVIGDTPRDIACAHAGGARAIAVAGPTYDHASLATGDAVVAGLAEAAEVALGWMARPS